MTRAQNLTPETKQNDGTPRPGQPPEAALNSNTEITPTPATQQDASRHTPRCFNLKTEERQTNCRANALYATAIASSFVFVATVCVYSTSLFRLSSHFPDQDFDPPEWILSPQFHVACISTMIIALGVAIGSATAACYTWSMLAEQGSAADISRSPLVRLCRILRFLLPLFRSQLQKPRTATSVTPSDVEAPAQVDTNSIEMTAPRQNHGTPVEKKTDLTSIIVATSGLQRVDSSQARSEDSDLEEAPASPQ